MVAEEEVAEEEVVVVVGLVVSVVALLEAKVFATTFWMALAREAIIVDSITHRVKNGRMESRMDSRMDSRMATPRTPPMVEIPGIITTHNGTFE